MYVLSPKLKFAKSDKHYPSRSGQTSLATAVTNFTKSVTKNNFGPRTLVVAFFYFSTLIRFFPTSVAKDDHGVGSMS